MNNPPPPSTPLAQETQVRLEMLFQGADRSDAESLLVHECGRNLPFCEEADPEGLDRIRIATLKLSEGRLDKLVEAIELGQIDWRDLLMAAGFGHDVEAHLKWMPEE